MKVVLLHEYSGVHTELAKGLRALGVSARTANLGDLHKKFPSDLDIGPAEVGLSNSIRRALRQLGLLRTFEEADILQSIAATPFNPIVSWFLEAVLLHRKPSRFVYLAAGSDAVYRRHVKKLAYWPPHDWYVDERQQKLERRIIDQAQTIVAGAYDYEFTYREEGFNPVFVPWPMTTKEIEQHPIGRHRRLRVYHPLNRVDGNDFKGTSHIRKAFEKLADLYPNDFEFSAAGGMPFSQYMEYVKSVDVVVDQANSQGYGMSAAFALAQGKVVLSGCEDVTHVHEAYANAPIINIRPDAEQICAALLGLLSRRTEIPNMGDESRRFVERYHESTVVAAQYLKLYRGGILVRSDSAA